jgi:hypothetical protein
MPRQVIERVHALAADQPEKLIFYDRPGRAIGDNSTNIELTESDARIEEEQEERQVAAQLQDCIQPENNVLELDEGTTDEEEMSLPGLTHGVEYNSNTALL